MPSPVSTQSIKIQLLNKFLPLIMLAIVAMLIGSIGAAWYRSSQEGQRRTAALTKYLELEIQEIREEAAIASLAAQLALANRGHFICRRITKLLIYKNLKIKNTKI
jgi:hypothetical protein